MTGVNGHSNGKSNGADSLAAYADHEVLTAERMKWWGVFLIREKRRLQAIADAVNDQGIAAEEGIASIATKQVIIPGSLE